MMTVAQIVKHVDGSDAHPLPDRRDRDRLHPARRPVAGEAVRRRPTASRSPRCSRPRTRWNRARRCWRKRCAARITAPTCSDTGKLALQFGYSDSGRYVGQLAASYLIERLRLKIAAMLERHDVRGVEVILFDTHGESIGRGAHPGSLADRLKYLSPTASRQALFQRRSRGARGKRLPGRRRLSAVRHAGTGAGHHHPHRRANLPSRRPVRSRTRSMPIPISPPTSSPPSAPAWKTWSRTPATAPCSAPSVRPCSTAPARGRPRGNPTAWPAARASAIRASCAPSRTTRSSSSSAGARTRCKGSARRRRGTRRRSPRCTRTADGSAAPWIWRRTAWRIRISTCCAR